MNIIEAVKSGKKFKRMSGHGWYEPGPGSLYYLPPEHILADDWEVEEEKIEITKSQFEKAFLSCSSSVSDFEKVPTYKCRYDLLLNRLGFKE